MNTFPKYAPIPRASEITGLGRSTLYKLAGEGKIKLIKAGGRSLVDIEHALAWMQTLPTAQIAPSNRPALRRPMIKLRTPSSGRP